MDAEILARIQFAFTIAFHYIYPPLSIGLGVVLVIMEGIWLKTGNVHLPQHGAVLDAHLSRSRLPSVWRQAS